jgi:ACS family tartrate transporter-like MFS transporter
MSPANPGLARQTRRRITLRLMPFLFLLYLVSYLDRVNVSYASLEMTRNLHFANVVFGLGSGIFFLGYLVLEIPGAILVERWSARKWIARIMISWGFFAALTGFIHTPTEFYGARFLLGLAEAGFFPGILVYVSHWYRQEDRAKAVAFFMVGIPFSEIIGAPVSGLLLQVHWFGIEGWRWLFLLEGVPAIVLGIVTIFYLTDRPEQARWLTAKQRDWISGELERERRSKPPSPGKAPQAEGPLCAFQPIIEVLRHPSVILLALAYFCILSANWGFTLWLPKIVQRLSGLGSLKVSLISGIPFLIEIPVLLLLAWHSDKTAERRWHVAFPVGVGALAFAIFASSDRVGANVVVTMVLFSIAAAGLHGYRASFWTLPTLFLSDVGAAAGIGVINCFGNLGGFLGPYMVGFLSNNTGSYRSGMLFLGGCALMASVFVLLVRVVPTPAPGSLPVTSASR